MKKLLFVLLLPLVAKAQNNLEDSLRYFRYFNTYGVSYPRIWATKILRTPFGDTAALNALPGAIQAGLDGYPYWWNGTKWATLNTGQSLVSLDNVLSNNPNLYNDYYSDFNNHMWIMSNASVFSVGGLSEGGIAYGITAGGLSGALMSKQNTITHEGFETFPGQLLSINSNTGKQELLTVYPDSTVIGKYGSNDNRIGTDSTGTPTNDNYVWQDNNLTLHRASLGSIAAKNTLQGILTNGNRSDKSITAGGFYDTTHRFHVDSVKFNYTGPGSDTVNLQNNRGYMRILPDESVNLRGSTLNLNFTQVNANVTAGMYLPFTQFESAANPFAFRRQDLYSITNVRGLGPYFGSSILNVPTYSNGDTVVLRQDLANYFSSTGGDINGYVGLLPQSSAPATPLSGVRLYARSTGALSWKGANGYERSFVGTGLTANRTYTLPDSSVTLAGLENAQTFTGIKTFTPAGYTNFSATIGNVFGTNTQPGLWVNDGNSMNAALCSSNTDLMTVSGQNQSYTMAFTVADSSNSANRGVMRFTRSRGTLAAPLAVKNNDDIGSLLASAYDGTQLQGSAGIFFKADGDASNGIAPQRISFVTSATSGSVRTEKFLIKSTGIINHTNDIIPTSNLTVNLGSSTNTYNNVWTNTLIAPTGSALNISTQSTNSIFFNVGGNRAAQATSSGNWIFANSPQTDLGYTVQIPTTTGRLYIGDSAALGSRIFIDGGASGTALLTMRRRQGGSTQYSWALASGGLSFNDDINGAIVGNFLGDNSTNQLFIGQRGKAVSDTRPSEIAATSFSSSLGNINGQDLRVTGGLGVGPNTPGNIVFRTGSAASSGVAQTAGTRLTISPTLATFNVNTTHQHIIGGTSAPTIAANTGAGTSPTIGISGTDLGFTVTLTAGTSPVSGTDLFTVTFATAYGATPTGVNLTSLNANAAGLIASAYSTPGTTTYKLSLASGIALTAGQQYKWSITIIQ